MSTTSTVPAIALDREGAALATSLSVTEIDRLVKANEVPHFRQGRRVIFPVRELTKWLSDRAAAQRGDRRLRRSLS